MSSSNCKWGFLLDPHQVLTVVILFQVVIASFVFPTAADTCVENEEAVISIDDLTEWLESRDHFLLKQIGKIIDATPLKQFVLGDRLTGDEEQQLGTDPTKIDSDGDGITDYEETDGGQPIDIDQDGTIDALDTDSDGDSIPDRVENANNCGTDGTPNYRNGSSDNEGKVDKKEQADGTDPYEKDSGSESMNETETEREETSGMDDVNRTTTIPDSNTGEKNSNGGDGTNHTENDTDSTGTTNGHDTGPSSNTNQPSTTHTPTAGTTATTTSRVDGNSSTKTTHTPTTKPSTEISQATTGQEDTPGSDTLPDINSPIVALIGILCVIGGIIAITRKSR